MSRAPLLQVQHLSTQLGSLRVLEDLNFCVYPGETFALLGESGCGKSMTALSLLRLLPPNGRIVSGQVHLNGRDLLQLPEFAMRQVRGGQLAMIFQEPQTSLNPVLTLGQQLAESLRLHRGLSGQAISERAVDLLKAVGIPDPERRLGEYPHQLSGGMKQRVMIAMALAGEPKLLIADEPTTALDVTIQAQVLALLKQLQRDTGLAVLLITHDLGVVAETADRLAVLYAGQILETGPSQAFFERPLHPYSRKLLESLPDPQKRGAPLATIEGRVPPLDQRFSGCRFAPRCPLAQEICHQEIPPWHQLDGERGVRCFLWESTPPLVPVRPVSEKIREAGETLLQVEGLRVHFPIRGGLFRRVRGAVKAVDGVDLCLRRGQTLALVGESGCGKTTVGKAILRLIPITAGTIQYDGQDLARLRPRALRPYRKELQIIFQDPFASLNPRLLVGESIAEGLQALGLVPDPKARRRRVVQLLEQVGLDASAYERYPHEFSGGQRQRICIARALAVEPKLILCDEPTSALDVSVQAQILNLLRRLQQDMGLSYLFISHNLSVVAYLAQEVAVMYLGRILEYGRVEEILEAPQHPYTRALLSAVPQIYRTKKQIIRLPGELPSPAQPPPGCHFHPRCPEAGPDCLQPPPKIKRSETHWVRCVRRR